MNLLKIRVEALQSNLDKIKGHLKSIPDPRTDLDTLDQHLKEMLESLKRANIAIFTARMDVDENEPVIYGYLKQAEEELTRVKGQLTNAKSLISSMRKKCFRIQESDVGKEIIKDLDTRPILCVTNLELIENSLNMPTPDLKRQWDDFNSTLKDSNDIFEEYIEFLGGLAVRDTGFDEGISLIADELIRTYYSDKKWSNAIAIPTREQTFTKSLARIIRVTFPDWTIWSLPSTAHEFWHVVVQKDLEYELRAKLRVQTGNFNDTVELRFDNCLADAFATYTMGPAYPYYAILLLLNPLNCFHCKSADVADDVRARAIFKMLECMDSKETGLDSPYAKVRKYLEKEWAVAITETSVQPTDEEINQIEADKARVTTLIEALWTTLSSIGSSPFTTEVWNEIKKWVQPLLDGQVDKIEKPQGAELRHVLNAAWLARVDPKRDPMVDITAVANELAKRVINKS